MAAGVLLALTLASAIGFLALRALAGQSSEFLPWELPGLAFGAGTGIVSLGMFYLAVGRVPVNGRNTWFLVAGLLAGLLAGFLVLNLLLRTIGQIGVRRSSRGRQAGEVGAALPTKTGLGLLLVIGLSVVLVCIDAVSQPLLSFDARAIWAYKAKVVFHEQTIYSQSFLEAERLHAKTRYPQLVPLAEVFVCHFAGRFEERAFKMLFPAFFVSLLWLVYFALRTHFTRRYCLAAVALFGSLPAFIIYANGGAASGYADLTLAFYTTAFAVFLVRWVSGGSAAMLRLAALFGALMLFTKAEGLALLLIISLVALLFILKNKTKRSQQIWPLPVALAISGVALIPWFHYQAQLPVVDEDFFKLLSLSNLLSGMNRLPFILFSLAKEFFAKPHLWNVLGLLAVTALLLTRRRTTGSNAGAFLWIPALYMVQLTAIFLVIPWPLGELLPVALTRLTMHTAPLLFIWISFQLGASGILPSGWILRDSGPPDA